MAAVREEQQKNGKVKEKLENGQLSNREILMSSLPKEKEVQIINVPEPYPVVKEVRIITDAQGTEKSVTDIIREEIGKVKIWEYKTIPISEFSVKDLTKLGKDGWRYAFDLTPAITHSVKVTTFIFQRAKL